MSPIKIANAPVSWGTLEFEGMQGGAIGYQQMLDELAATGYTGTELGDWGYLPTDPSGLSQEMRTRNLTMLGAFVPVRLKNEAAHAEGQQRAVKTARLLSEASAQSGSDNTPFIVLADDNATDPLRTQNAGRIAPAMALANDEWKTFVDGVERIARAVKTETGLRLVFHHHCAGYVETPDEIVRFLDSTDPELVGMVFDTGHYLYGTGANDSQALLDGLETIGNRVWHVHLKDCHPQVANRARSEGWDYLKTLGQGIFCELGKGAVEFPPVISWLNSQGYDGWGVVEQDILPGMGTPKDSAQRNRDYLRGIGL